MVDRQKYVKPSWTHETLLEDFAIVNLWHFLSRIWTSTEPKFRLFRIKINTSQHYTAIAGPNCNYSTEIISKYYAFIFPLLFGKTEKLFLDSKFKDDEISKLNTNKIWRSWNRILAMLNKFEEHKAFRSYYHKYSFRQEKKDYTMGTFK